MINWSFKKFDDLTSNELYLVLQLRNEVFVVEQRPERRQSHGGFWRKANLEEYAHSGNGISVRDGVIVKSTRVSVDVTEGSHVHTSNSSTMESSISSEIDFNDRSYIKL